MRKPIIIGNWKMNKSIEDSIKFIKELEEYSFEGEVGIAAQSAALTSIKKCSKNILVGAQNVNDNISGAYTGEVSVELLKEVNVDFCLVGHSERRQYYNENDKSVNTKAKLLLEYDIIPVICVGETLVEYENNQTQQIIEKQIELSCQDLDIEKCVIAYEPVWAIGTGKTATSEIAQNVCYLIRNKLATMYTNELAQKVRIQYGGSVKPDNIKEIMGCTDIDGALVGGASLEVESFKQLID